MNRLHLLALSALSTGFLIGWSGQENTSLTKKNRVNFYGTLETHAGNTLKIDNISVAHIYKQVKLYEVPNSFDKTHKRVMLASNPKEGIVTMVDLKESCSIEADPNFVFVYKKKKGSREIEFVKITVTSKDKTRTKHEYLIEVNRKLICDEVNDAGPIEKEVPFNAIKKLTLDGWKFREDQKDDKNNFRCNNEQAAKKHTREETSSDEQPTKRLTQKAPTAQQAIVQQPQQSNTEKIEPEAQHKEQATPACTMPPIIKPSEKTGQAPLSAVTG